MAENDLVQQTRSANAAEATAWLAYNQSLVLLIGTVLGCFTLIAAIAAAKFARDAAIETKRSADIAADASRNKRAWLSLSIELRSNFVRGRTHEGIDGYYIEVALITVNHGNSPATGIRLNAECRTTKSASGGTASSLQSFGDRWRIPTEGWGSTLFPSGGKKEQVHICFVSDADIADGLYPIEGRRMLAFVIFASASYESPYADGVRQTRVADRIGTVVNQAPMLFDIDAGPLDTVVAVLDIMETIQAD